MNLIFKRLLSAMGNRFLLAFPFLYHTKILNYETRLGEGKGIEDLFSILDTVLYLEGNIIECGSYKCGTSILIANYIKSKKIEKLIFACDSFEGFVPEELQKEKKEGLTHEKGNSFTSTSYTYVKKKIKKLGLQDRVIPIKGFFKDTLKTINSKYCLVLIDADLKESIIYCFMTLWQKLEVNGCVLIDDYLSAKYKGAKQAIELILTRYKDEISKHGLVNRLYYIYKKCQNFK